MSHPQFAAIFIAYKGIAGLSKEKNGLTFADVFTDALFRNIVLSIAATTGLYLISSLIFVGDFTSNLTKMEAD